LALTPRCSAGGESFRAEHHPPRSSQAPHGPTQGVGVDLPSTKTAVTQTHCPGHHCAEQWISMFSGAQDIASPSRHSLCAQSASISHVTKREFAEAISNDFHRLLTDRAYKEQYRPALTAFYNEQVSKRPRLPEEHFLTVVHGAAATDVDVLFITGMRDEAPVASFCHLSGGCQSDRSPCRDERNHASRSWGRRPNPSWHNSSMTSPKPHLSQQYSRRRGDTRNCRGFYIPVPS
jgi:hypothetical protein